MDVPCMEHNMSSLAAHNSNAQQHHKRFKIFSHLVEQKF